MFNLQSYEPGRNEPCLCASGLKYKHCCMGHYSSAAQKEAHRLYNQGKYPEALSACRRHLTWYLLCHQAHTVPLLPTKRKEILDLLHIDIEALGEIVGLLHLCYYRNNCSDDFPKVLESLSHAVNDSRWNDKIAYLRGLWWLADKDDRVNAYNAIAQVNIKDCKDAELLTIYLDVCPIKLPLHEQTDILDRIIDNTPKQSYKLQYGVFKGLVYCFVNELDPGCKIIKAAIDAYRDAGNEDRTPYGEFQLARALQLLGELSKETSYIEESAEQYNVILAKAERDGYSGEYLADISKCLADSMYDLEKYPESLRLYQTSLQHKTDDLTKVFLARAYIQLNKFDDAKKELISSNTDRFDINNQYDYAISWALLATHSLLPEDLEMAKTLIKAIPSHWPLFTMQRDEIMIQLLELTPKSSKSRTKAAIRFLNKYISLKPNLFGIGLDINKIVEDAIT